MSRNRVIGRGGALPWRLPEDLKRFKQRTMGHAVVMGRKTWDTMRKPLPGRTNIVLTRDASFQAEGAVVVQSLDDAIDAAIRSHPLASEAFIIGGAEIYRQALPIADRIDLTRIDTVIHDGDAFFPEFEDDPAWQRAAAHSHPADDRHAFGWTFESYERGNQITASRPQ